MAVQFMRKFLVITLVPLLWSCAPVKFSRSDTVNVSAENVNAITCNPKINGTLITFTYSGSTLPGITTNCSDSDSGLNYEYTVKRADGSLVTQNIGGLVGEAPANVDFRPLGQGNYYVFLKASGAGKDPFVATSPLEFIVPGAQPLPTLACDPILNGSLRAFTMGMSDNNPTVNARCNPGASVYNWSVTRSGVAVTISGLSGSSSTPDFRAAGPGTYLVSLNATATGYNAFNSSTNQILTVVVQNPGSTDPILCAPRINGNLTSLTLTSASSFPLISANCNPSQVQYNWSVTKSGSNISVPDLAGPNSNPNFFALGVGTYHIRLTASSPGKTTWTSSSPLEITVATNQNQNTISCQPRLNDTLTSVGITTAGPNPKVTSGCTPNTATLVWTVKKNGTTVTVPGLAGASSVPSFTSLGTGTYLITLTATQTGYNPYTSPSPLTVIVDTAPVTYRNVETNRLVGYSNNKVDFLLVLDVSNSMLPDNQHLASRLQGFLDSLVSSTAIDWQMCLTVTTTQNVGGTPYWGAASPWIGYSGYVLKPSASVSGPALSQIFTNTISTYGAGWVNSDDERPLKAAWHHIDYRNANGCYRTGAALAMIVLSDEDERSVGGDPAQVGYYNEFQFLEDKDLPQTLINKVKSDLGSDKPFTFNSVIVKPGDTSCKASQDAAGYLSHYGFKLAELSTLTSGATTSICASDYSQNLNYFKDRIVDSLSSIQLECPPIADPVVTITPPVSGGFTTRIENGNLIFTPAIKAERTINVKYKCAIN